MTTLDNFDLSGVEHLGFDDLRGWITFRNLPDELQRQLDQTQADDWERRSWRPSQYRTRPASVAEKILLTHLGFVVPSNLETRVRYVSAGIRLIEFPALTDQLEALQ
jgi:hypothetical protein